MEKAGPTTDPEVEQVSSTSQDYAVDWEGDDDPENPQNWTSKKKAINVALFSTLTFITYVPSILGHSLLITVYTNSCTILVH